MGGKQGQAILDQAIQPEQLSWIWEGGGSSMTHFSHAEWRGNGEDTLCQLSLEMEMVDGRSRIGRVRIIALTSKGVRDSFF